MTTSGADVLVQHLKANNVDTIFAITGAGNLAIIDAIVRDSSFNIIYSHHEQAVVMEAQGYSRTSGKLGVALVTTGGGTSNVVTGVLSAYLDSIPVLLISGNESSFHCANSSNLRAYGVQGFDSVAVLKPVTKYSERIIHTGTLSEIVNNAIQSAVSDRKGPAHIDFPMDLQRQQCVGINIEEVIGVQVAHTVNLESVIESLNKSHRPMFYFGNGCRDNIEAISKLISKTGIPYAVSWSALDLFDHDDPLNIGTIGIYGSHSANIVLQKADLILSVGTRLAIPQIGYDKEDFGRKAEKIVIDIDATELSKFENLGWKLINTSAAFFADYLLGRESLVAHDRTWANEINLVKEKLPLINHIGAEASEGYVHSARVLEILPKLLSEEAIIVTDVGAPLLNGHYIMKPGRKQRLFTSQGLGEMGFGLPGAIGAHFANPNRQIVCLNTDGAIMFNLQELQLVKHHRIPLKLFIFNNSGYGMIKISQENLFESRLSGSDTSTGISFPNFESVAATFGLKYSKVHSIEELKIISQDFSSNDAHLIDVQMDPIQKYFPRLATNKLSDGTLVSPPLEDLTPFIQITLLEELLEYKPSEASFKSRGLTAS